MQDSLNIKFNKNRAINVSWSAVVRRPLSSIFSALLTGSLVLGFLVIGLLSSPRVEGHSEAEPAHPDAASIKHLSAKAINASKVARELIPPSSVVKFEVPVRRIEQGERRNFIENCSAYAVQKTSEYVFFLSAWHCVDGFQRHHRLPVVKHAGRTVQPTLGESGGNMKRDWLLMTAPTGAFDDSLALTPLASEPVKAGEILHGFGWGGHAQTSRSTPKSLRCKAIEVGNLLTLDCGFSKGDSGGLMARKINDGYEAVGIISAGDSSTVTYAYPISALPPSLSSLLFALKD
mgnify:FL=1